MLHLIRSLRLRTEGQDLIEYALLVALIVLVGAATIDPLGQTVAKVFTDINGQFGGQ